MMRGAFFLLQSFIRSEPLEEEGRFHIWTFASASSLRAGCSRTQECVENRAVAKAGTSPLHVNQPPTPRRRRLYVRSYSEGLSAISSVNYSLQQRVTCLPAS